MSEIGDQNVGLGKVVDEILPLGLQRGGRKMAEEGGDQFVRLARRETAAGRGGVMDARMIRALLLNSHGKLFRPATDG